MKHQIIHLFMAIIIFAGIATSAVKADEIEGTWTQEGQYKKFSKEYTDLKLFEVSADGTKIAIVTDSTLRIFDIQSGIIQTKLTIPDISDYPHQPYCISKDFKYFGLSQSDYSYDGSEINLYIHAKVLNISNNKLILDTIINYSYSEIEAYPEIETKNYFCNNNTFFLQYSLYSGRWYRWSDHFNLIFDCTTHTSIIDYEAHPFNTIYFLNDINTSVGYYNQHFVDDISGSEADNHRFYRKIFIQKDSIISVIANESWEYRSDGPIPPIGSICPIPLGITGDDKMLMTHIDGKYIFYDLDSIGKFHKIDSAFNRYRVLAVLFPNSNNGKSFMTIHHGDLGNVKISERSYTDGCQLASYEIYGNHFSNYWSNFKLIDSSRIIICKTVDTVRQIYILDLNLKNNYPEFDITSDIQSGTTNDTVKFSIKFPATHRDIIVDYGDGTSDSEYPYHHVYSKPGTYSVKINALNKDNVYEAFKRKDYINISQGLELSCDVFHYCMPDNIQIKVINTSTGNHANHSITIAPLSDLDNARAIKGKDTLIIYFTEYCKYKITIKAFDSDGGIICRKDSIIDITPTSSPNISSEIYYNINLKSYLEVYENYNTVDFLSYESRVNGNNTNFSLVTINNNDQLSRKTKLYCYFGYNYSQKIAPTKYDLDGTIYDFATGTNEKNPLDFTKYNLQYFNYNDSLYGQITKPNQITIYSSSTHQVGKTLTNKNLNINWGSRILPFTSKNGIIYLWNKDNAKKINCYTWNTQTDTINQVCFNNSYSNLGSIRNSCQYSDDIFLSAVYNRVFRFNLSNSEVDSLIFGETKIEGLCAIKDKMIAVITRNKEMETVIDLVNNSFTKFKTITLSKREDVIQYCNITPDNQLRIIYSTKYGDLYLCRVPILDIASSSVAEFKPEEVPLVFPNPASNSISIQYPLDAKASIKIVDETGQVYSARISSANTDNFSIDTSLLPDGTYFVQIQGGEINKSVKFMVKR